MKIKSLILLAIFSLFILSCEKDMTWINAKDPQADSEAIALICAKHHAECGDVNIYSDGKFHLIFCGNCETGYKCDNDSNKCYDIDECSRPELNDCPENSTCADEEGTYSCICNENYSGDDCVPGTRTKECENLPENAEWNTASSITQTWNGTSWEPATTPVYSEAPSENECSFKCVSEEYAWDGESCVVSSSGDTLTLGNICTGQTSCYNASSSMTCPSSSSADFFGQDAQYTNKCTAQSFTASSNVVVDNNTGLTWEKSPSTEIYTWDNRDAHCNDLNSSNYGGINTWRVPNPLELLTIVNNSTYNPATNSNFTEMPTDSGVLFWTSAEYKGNTSYAYAFKPYYGSYDGYDGTSYSKTKIYKVLCVSGDEMKPAISSDFTTSLDGKIVTDNRTGLMWQKEYATGKTWQQALKYCEDLSYAGYSDWRLPNKNELASLVNYEKSGSPYSYFPDMPDMPSGYFWSSSTNVGNADYAWFVGFVTGGVSDNGKSYNGYVRCVR